MAARERAPSMIEAWFSSSDTMTSSLPRTAATVPELAVNPDWKHERVLRSLERREPLLELAVHRHLAGDRPDRAGSRPVFRRRPRRASFIRG